MTLEQRLDDLEAAFKHSLEVGTQIKQIEGQTMLEMKAKNDVLTTMVAELCIHLGIATEQISPHLQKRYAHFLDRRLREAEKIDAGISASLDGRGLHEVPTEEKYPPLFPDQE